MRKALLFLAVGMLYAAVTTSLGRSAEIYYDSLQYFHYGQNLLERGTYGHEAGVPDMNREPGYGVFLAGAFSMIRGVGLSPSIAGIQSPERLFWVRWLQALLLFLCAGFCAFRGGLPERLRRPLFFLAIASPTMIGIAREIYSEALAIPLGFLLLGLSANLLRGGSRWNLLGAFAVAFALVLTKSYFQYFGLLLLACAGVAAALPRFRRHPATALGLVISLGILLGQQAWNARNRSVFGNDVRQQRVSIALAGKILRLHRVQWDGKLPVALAAAVGTNFCDRFFDATRCTEFDIRGCDQVGVSTLAEYESRMQDHSSAVDTAIRRDMFRLYLERPFTQLAGTGLEFLRMALFEAVADSDSFPAFLHLPLHAWHLGGSLLFWGLILLGLRRRPRAEAEGERAVRIGCARMIAYHFLFMGQITNLARYVFPVLPFLYLFVAEGVAALLPPRGAAGNREATHA